ncbi:unnamed protein product [Rotaria magnacalcarata]|uniref:FAD-binding PCMH-type domain-containing protein n=1 Tax=Rotaria magnacalcarata TaxID=392030 RepID=A0A819UEB9_9BILA|nr:unnamed protein product [Rotaria magnacalcarata]
MKIIRETQVPFGVKGGGHTLNPGFSSTTGIHIAMRRFDKVIYHANNQTVDVDSGLIWDDVYKALDPYNVSVVGGRVSGVGVAGFTLGGGYSWKSNQFGLAIDNVLGYELVSPNGTIVYVTNDSYSDIFFGLKGGFNNFGIVTNFKLRALPQTLVYGGLLIYVDIHKFDNILTALVNFQNNNKDPKAQLLPSFFRQAGLISFTLTVFYDAPTAPTSTFDEFMNISHFGVLKTRSFLSFIKAVPVFITDGMRHSSLAVFTAEPFLSTYFDKSQGGAYPHVPSTTPLLPVLVQFGWQLPEDDEFFINEIKLTVDSIMQVVLNEEKNGNGTIQIRYPNYALETTPLSEMYGDNLPRLQSIRKAWDPDNVMNLTGGFKF